MTLATFPQTSLGSAAAAVVDRLAPAGIQRIPCPDDATWHALRRQDITASVAAALLGAADPEDQHAYATPYQLYMLARGAVEPESIDEEGPILRGWLMEEPAVRLLRRRNPTWIVQHNTGEGRVYYRDPATRMGCTPDAIVNDPQRGIGIVQIKSVEASIFRRKWKNDDGDIEPPLWIAVQAIVEATLVGASWAAVAPIVVGHGVEMPLIDVPLHGGIMTRLREAVAEFWRRVDARQPYDPDFGRDGELISRLYDDPTPGVIADLTADNHLPEIAAEDEILAGEIKVKTARRKEIKKEFEFKIGNCAGAIFRGGSATKKIVHKKAYSVPASSYPDIRIKRA
jgi:hypothetical protein